MSLPQLFNATALRTARIREQVVGRDAKCDERPNEALRALLGDIAARSTEIHRFVIERFAIAALPLPIAVAFGLVVSRFLLALPLEAVRRRPLRHGLLCTWYAFRYGEEAEETWRLEVLTRIAGGFYSALELDLARATSTLTCEAQADQAIVECARDFARTLVLTVFATIYHETNAPRG